MNFNIKTLFDIASKSERIIVGLMSGTSMDGLDIALCSVVGSGLDTKVRLLEFETATYSPVFKEKLLNIFSKGEVSFQEVTIMNVEIAQLHAELVNQMLAKWNIERGFVDVIASHGQTVFHAPQSFHKEHARPNATLQIGDGDHIATRTGIITVSDFRQKHIAHGGEGAPLAVYGDYLMFANEHKDTVLLNIGGISNFTFLPKASNISQIFTTDIGPGNTLMNQYMQYAFGEDFDRDAQRAKGGVLNEALLNKLLLHPFFDLNFPKSTGPELFTLSYVLDLIEQIGQQNLKKEDLMCTLCHFTARVISKSIKDTINIGTTIYASGGGIHNPLLWKLLAEQLEEYTLSTTDNFGIHPDAKEAIIFALLANECIVGEPIDFCNENLPSTTFGKISFPK